MLKTLKHWLVPHRGNRHQPRIISGVSLLLIGFTIVGLQLTYNMTVNGQARVLSYATNISEAALVELTNQERVKAGVSALTINSSLREAAQAKAADMLARDYWSHLTPDGVEPWQFITDNDYRYTFAGENLAKGFSTSQGVITGWLNSPGHRANLLSSNYTEIGLTVANGHLDGDTTTLVVAFYASPLDEPLVSPADTQPTPTELAPSPQNYSVFHPLLVTQMSGWGQLVSLGLVGSMMPVYVMTHISMWRHHLHYSARRLWRRRWLEFAALLALATSLLLSGLGSVG